MSNNNQTIKEQLKISDAELNQMGQVGAMYYQQGNFDKAKTIFEGLVELDPKNANAHSAYGALLTLKLDDDLAIKHLQQAVELNPKQIAPFVNLGEIYIRRQMLEAAVANLKKAIELDPDEKDSGANRARAMVLGIYQIIHQKQQAGEMPETESKQNN